MNMHVKCDSTIVALGTENDELKRRLAEITAGAPRADGKARMTVAQRDALWALCGRYNVAFNEADYGPAFDLPDGWVSGWVGGKVYVGVSPEGQVCS